jgi:hypothetical protein
MAEINYYEPINVGLIENKWDYDEKDYLPAHDFVIRPLLKNCIYCNIYGIENDRELFIENKEVLVKEKGKYK